jgi:cytochrome c553
MMFMAGGCTWGFGGGNRDVPEMHRNLSRTVDIQTGVVQGDLDRAKNAASWILAREDQMVFPPGAESYQEEMLAFATSISEAEDLRFVAAQTGQLAAACGSCHQAVGGGPNFVVGGSQPNGNSQEAQMVRHLWAADRMWEGLVGPSEESWMAGARAMAETQPAMARVFRASTHSNSSEGFLKNINLLATEALNAYELGQRAEVYGRLLDTCNRCHTPAGIQVEK